MSHARSGLPPLNLEPFDPTPLYAAANSPRRDKHQPNHKEKRNPYVAGLAATVVLALGAAAAFFLG
ncbi:MAG TPA: hypothetical protein VES93_02950 [Ornithinibacter sp.]|nr:hypothetical protein [Ornithinibacter sp.]